MPTRPPSTPPPTCAYWASQPARTLRRPCAPCRPSSCWTPTAGSRRSSLPRATRPRRCTRSSAPPACPAPGNRPSHGALEGKPLLIGTTRDEATAFTAFDPHIQGLTTDTALDLLTAQVGQQAAQDLYQQHAARRPQATPAQIFTAVLTDGLFRDGSLEVADHHAAGGNATYVYQFDYAPAEDPYALGATHCAELPFLFNTFDAYPGSPILAGVGARDAQGALGREFATAVAEFVATGTTSNWLPYATAARIRHFG